MGFDIEIEIRGELTPDLLEQINERLEPVRDERAENYQNIFVMDDGFARLDTLWRYWGPGCERGPWRDIAFVLGTMLGFPGVTEVRYGHDEDVRPVLTEGRLAELWAHYRGPGWNDYYA